MRIFEIFVLNRKKSGKIGYIPESVYAYGFSKVQYSYRSIQMYRDSEINRFHINIQTEIFNYMYKMLQKSSEKVQVMK